MLIAGVTANRRIRTSWAPQCLTSSSFRPGTDCTRAICPESPHHTDALGCLIGKRASFTTRPPWHSTRDKTLRISEPGRDRIVFGDKLPLRQSQSAISRRSLLQQQDWGDVCKSESVVGTNIHRGMEFELYQKAKAWTR